jgi:hypothetical protein
MSDELDRCMKAPSQLTVGRYRWEFYPGLRFGLCDTRVGRGVGRCRTPWGAWIALRRWKKQPGRPV